ncbi:hypothetical protein Aph02nite_79980 [Actinoplanes philippinensis]|nr:hypothetical protein Aph02nite_79980 [Actinoplanes philippinensis]
MPTPDLSVTEAFDEALRADNEDRRWELVAYLHRHGGREALHAATRLAGHDDPAHRELAADVLSQLKELREEALTLLLTTTPAPRPSKGSPSAVPTWTARRAAACPGGSRAPRSRCRRWRSPVPPRV